MGNQVGGVVYKQLLSFVCEFNLWYNFHIGVILNISNKGTLYECANKCVLVRIEHDILWLGYINNVK